MDFLDGNHELDPFLAHYEVEQRKQLYNQKIDILSELTLINIKEIGLERFGRPEGYLNRQIKLWINQYRNSQTKEIESMEYLIEIYRRIYQKRLIYIHRAYYMVIFA